MMTDIFEDQKRFMQAGGQTTDLFNLPQLELYERLIDEEIRELREALHDDSGRNQREAVAEIIDGAIDSIVVLAGFLWSMGIDPAEAWREVMRSNMSKVDPETGKIEKREDGKILKPSTYSPPDLTPIVDRLAHRIAIEGAVIRGAE